MSFFTSAQNVCLQNNPIVLPHTFSELKNLSREAIIDRLRLVLEDGQCVQLRSIYIDHLWNVMHMPSLIAEHNWLHITTEGLYFLTRSNMCLPLVWNNMSPPHVRRTSVARFDAVPLVESTPFQENAINNNAPDFERMHIIVDQSGSMQNVQQAVYEGARELVQDLPDDAVVTFSKFSNVVQVGEAKTKTEVLSDLSYTPIARGSTALYDAIVAVLNQETRPHTTVVLVTDGEDTSSQTSTRDNAREACRRFQEQSTNRILFLGSHQDAVLSAQTIGIPVGRALTFGTRDTDMRTEMRSASDNVQRFRSLGVDEFTTVERQASIAP